MGSYLNEQHSYRDVDVSWQSEVSPCLHTGATGPPGLAALSHLMATSVAKVFMNLSSHALLLAISTSSWREEGSKLLLFSHYQLTVHFKMPSARMCLP